MIELKCQNCGSHDVDYRGKYLLCRACGAKFLLDREERYALSKMEELRVQENIERAMRQMQGDYGYWNHEGALKYARRAYTADENNPDAIYCYAKAILYYEQITYENGALFLPLQERALELAADISEKKYNEMVEKFGVLRYMARQVWHKYAKDFIESRDNEELFAQIDKDREERRGYWLWF